MFKHTTIFSTVFITGLLLQNLAIAKKPDLIRSPDWGNFSQSCSNITFSNKTSFLRADCSPSSFTVISLNKYIANNNGVLTWTANGNFNQTCNLCQLKHHLGVVWLSCRCLRGQTEVNPKINLDERITNINGALRIVTGMPQAMPQFLPPSLNKKGL